MALGDGDDGARDGDEGSGRREEDPANGERSPDGIAPDDGAGAGDPATDPDSSGEDRWGAGAPDRGDAPVDGPGGAVDDPGEDGGEGDGPGEDESDESDESGGLWRFALDEVDEDGIVRPSIEPGDPDPENVLFVVLGAITMALIFVRLWTLLG